MDRLQAFLAEFAATPLEEFEKNVLSDLTPAELQQVVNYAGGSPELSRIALAAIRQAREEAASKTE